METEADQLYVTDHIIANEIGTIDDISVYNALHVTTLMEAGEKTITYSNVAKEIPVVTVNRVLREY